MGPKRKSYTPQYRQQAAHLRSVVDHRDQHRHPVGFGAVKLGRGGGAGTQRGEQSGVDALGQLLFVEGGEERGLDLGAGLLG